MEQAPLEIINERQEQFEVFVRHWAACKNNP